MKKLLSFLAAGALALGLIGCSGDLHDAEIIDLSGYGIRGTMTGWDKADDEPLTKNDDGTYSFSFTATGETDNFAVIEMGDASWNTAYRLAQPKSEGDTANTFDTEKGMEQKVYQGQSADCCTIKGLKKGDKVDLLITPDTTFITVKVTITAGAGAGSTGPVPYYLDGELFVGCDAIGNSFNVTDTSWLLYGCTLDKKTGEVTYTKDFTASACGHTWHAGDAAVKIADPNWKNSYGDTAITVGGDFVKLVAGGDNAPVSGLVAGKAYRAEIKTTPDKDVLIKIYEIASVTFKFEVTGLSEGELAWIGGQFWGASWDNGWPIEAWNKAPGCGLSVSDNAVADENGVAAFNDKWNVSTVAKPGETLSYAFKAIASTSNWEGDSPTSHETGDLSVDIEIEEDATYKISINIEDEEITVTKL